MNKRLLVCDLDNTLYDWVGFFVPAFYSMVDEVVRITKCDRDRLLDDFRTVHRRHHDSEHPFSLLDTKTIQSIFAGYSRREIAAELDSAFHSFNMSRKKNLRLYPGVRSTLDALSRSGLVLVAHTESKLHAVVDRLTRLELSGYFRRIYCRERSESEHPNPSVAYRWLEEFPLHKVVELSHHQRKPNPLVLEEICSDEGILPLETAYVGDSITRDIMMAKAAGVSAIWAKFGAIHPEGQYRKLVRISHWTADDVVREQELRERAREIEADYVLENGFSEILHALIATSRPSFTNRSSRH